jgi:hypothetical protein
MGGKNNEVKGCYKTNNSATGKEYVRKRPAINATVSESTLNMLKEMAMESGQSFASVVEKCIMFGTSQFRKTHIEASKQVTPIPSASKRTDMNNEELFMRKKLFDWKDNNHEWTTYP